MYCFGEDLPESDLVSKFIGYVIKDKNRTEDFTPFDGQGIDVTPVVRSFILQQLLAIKGRYVLKAFDVREHFSNFHNHISYSHYVDSSNSFSDRIKTPIGNCSHRNACQEQWLFDLSIPNGSRTMSI